ncbi:MAG TPA: alcohol dehydrogenase catalytic domain-containing protein [Chloroflexota bacterium]
MPAETMRVAVYYRNSDIRIEERPVPAAGPGELLVRVEACGICGSDALEWYRIKKAPLVLGHELAGVVVAVGEGVSGHRVGDRVVVDHHVPCGTCRFCRSGHETMCETLLHKTNIDPGGFAEFCRVPAINVEKGGVIPIPDHVSFEDASLAEPLATVLRGQRIAGIQPGQTVLVMGAGIVGLIHVLAARAAGARFVVATDISPYRLDAARTFGADAAWRAGEDVPARLKELTGGLADLVIVCTGARQVATEALRATDMGGTVLFFASTDPGVETPVSINDFFWRRDTTLTTTYAGTPEDYREALDMIASGRIDVHQMITHRIPLSDASQGFQMVASGQSSIKVIVEPQR